MTTTLHTARPNMAGTKKRLIHTAVRETLTAQFQQFDGKSGDQLETNLQAFLADIRAAALKHSAKAPKLFSSASTYVLGAVARKKTKKCFTSKLWYYRAGDLDNWLPADQPWAGAVTITVLTPMKDWTFAEAARSILNASPDTPVATLGALLKKHQLTMTLAQAEAMVEATERGENTGLRTDGYGNFFFVENEDGSVSVAYVDRDDRRWRAFVYELGDGYRWCAVYRLVVCNLDPLKLGL